MIFKIKNRASAWLCFVIAAFVLSITTYAADAKKLVPMGNAVGIELQLRGVVIADVVDFDTENGKVSPAKDAGIKPGDVLVMIDGTEIENQDDIQNVCSELCGDPVVVNIIRDGSEQQLTLKPFENGDGEYALGIWIRDGICGIGTLTFFDPETGMVGALGHPVSDESGKELVDIEGGIIVSADVTGAKCGKPGKPGQLDAKFHMDEVIGTVVRNTEAGIFGKMNSSNENFELLEIADSSQLELGEVTILSDVYGTEVKEYTAEVVRIYHDENDMRSFMIKVTDQELIEKTGGIVQGMSGSPILQNGKLVGAVTHVLVNDPTKGYGIFIENMLEAAENGVN